MDEGIETEATGGRAGVGRRALLAGLAGGTAGVVLGASPGGALAPPVSASAGAVAGADGRALPAPIPGATMIGISGRHFTTLGYSATSSAAVVGLAIGVGCSDDANRLWTRLDIPAGSRIARVDVYGYSTASATQYWGLEQTDPTTFTDVEIDKVNPSRTGAGPITAAMVPNHVVEPGYDYALVAASGQDGPYVRGVVVQYLAPFGEFYAIPPRRVHDSRSSGKIIGGTERLVSVATRVGSSEVVVPPGALAVAVNLTVTDTEGAGWLALRPFGQPATGTSSVNWSGGGQTDSNETPVQLGGDRELVVRAGGAGTPRAHFILDVVGYYL